jgi:hypothetical protein
MSLSHEQLLELLNESGFPSGWNLEGETLTVWEHEAEPPAPLKRPE